MMAEETPTAVDTLSRALARERVQSARHINLVRLCGVSAFFALFIVLGVVLRLPGWTGNLGLFTAYWLVAAALFWVGPRVSGGAAAREPRHRAGRRADGVLPAVGHARDEPESRVVSRALPSVSTSCSSSWPRSRWRAGSSSSPPRSPPSSRSSCSIWRGWVEGAMASTVILLGLGAAACSYARLRLVTLVERVERDIAEQRRAEAALRLAERTAALAALGRELSGTLDPPRWPSAPSTASRHCSGLRPPRSSASNPRPALSSPSGPAGRFSRASPPGRS